MEFLVGDWNENKTVQFKALMKTVLYLTAQTKVNMWSLMRVYHCTVQAYTDYAVPRVQCSKFTGHSESSLQVLLKYRLSCDRWKKAIGQL